jgi:hypothetical protein
VTSFARGIAVVGAGLVLLGACSSGGETSNPSTSGAPGAAPTTASTTTTTAAPAPTFPLTGLPLTDPAQGQKPALVIKIDNVDQYSRPQAGINQADIVYEEKIEGPISRFAAVFHSKELELVGPVRSGRSTDVAIVSTLNTPLYAFSGANEVFAKKLREAPLVYISHDNQPNLFDRRPGRTAPDNVFTSTARLRSQTPADAKPPEPQLTYRKAGSELPASATAVNTFNYDFGGGPVGQPVSFTWDDGKKGWTRTQKGSPHVDNDGVVIAPQNVIVQFTPYHDTGLVDLSKTPVPEAELVGSGDAWVFLGGKAVKAKWNKPDMVTVTSYVTADGGQPIAMDPGQTWIALVPTGGNFTATTAAGQPLA